MKLNYIVNYLDNSSQFSTWLFLRFLGCIYFIAFLSLWLQVDGLIGNNGILPAAQYIELAWQKLGLKSYFVLPSLFWFNPNDGMLHFLCAGGVVLSILVITGLLIPLALAGLWLFYLSLVSIGQDFLSFQWDILLLEAGFLAIFLGPWQLYTNKAVSKAKARFFSYRPFFLWLLNWLLFRLMFGSGFVKLVSDVNWRNLSALNYHYETQPLPTWLGWYAHQLPPWLQEFSVATMLAIELLVPLLIFGQRRLRNIACITLISLQVLILLTGNYGFFNLLTITLCLLLIDDPTWQRLLALIKLDHLLTLNPSPKPERYQHRRYIFTTILAGLLFLLSGLQFTVQLMGQDSLPAAIVRQNLSYLRPLHLVGTYGLFATMTKTRPEIIIEGSNDGLLWQGYRFKWKAGHPHKAPKWVAPHQPRLDWQMWFAALRANCRNAPWSIRFMVQLLRNSPEVTSLLAKNPFPTEPPLYIRAILYNYQFTDLATKQGQGTWWQRKKLSAYCPVFSRKP